LIGRGSESSKPFNIINYDYHKGEVGENFKMREQDNEMRRDARSRRMMMIGDSAFNIINGSDRNNVVGTIKPYLVGSDVTGAGRPIRSVAARIDVGDVTIGKKVHREYYPTTVQPIEDVSRISSPKSGKKIFQPMTNINHAQGDSAIAQRHIDSGLSSAGKSVVSQSHLSLHERPKPEYPALMINKHPGGDSPRSLFSNPPIQIGG